MTPEQIGAYAAVGGLGMTVIGGVIGYILHQRDKVQEDEAKRLSDGLKAAFLKIDALTLEAAKFWTRVEQENFRRELKQDITAMTERLEKDIDKLGVRLEDILNKKAG